MPQFRSPNLDTKDQNILLRQQQKCDLCPLKIYFGKSAHPVATEQQDVLIVSPPIKEILTQYYTGIEKTLHVFDVECTTFGANPTETARGCCSGRKLDFITKTKPKLVIFLDQEANFEYYKRVFLLSKPIYGELLPTEYQGHRFWCLFLEKTSSYTSPIIKNRALITTALSHQPRVESEVFSNIEFVMRASEIDAAFADIAKEEWCAIDLETNALRPYWNDSKILSAAIAIPDKTFAFPIHHPQTPRIFPKERVLEGIRDVTRKVKTIAHYSPFELEWLVYNFGADYAYEILLHDTCAQAYVIQHYDESKKLGDLIRRYFGFDLKKFSDIDVVKLMNEPIEKVLRYNGGDSKWTLALFFEQLKRVQELEQQHIYDIQIERIRAAVLMQHAGMPINDVWVQTAMLAYNTRLERLMHEWNQYPSVRRMGGCNPNSTKDVSNLFYTNFSLSKSQKQFDEPFLKTRSEPEAKTILQIRATNKILSTYLIPMAPGTVHNNKKNNVVFDDGMLHTMFNTMTTATCRLSSEFPNLQNLPSRKGKEVRCIIGAILGWILLAVDYAQIEYRIIACLAKDAVLINAIINNLDGHLEWTHRLMKTYPNKWVNENATRVCTKTADEKCNPPCYNCQIDKFRKDVKNQWTFPLCYGAGLDKVATLLSVSSDLNKLENLIAEFWKVHKGIHDFQKNCKRQLEQEGFITNAYGRKYYAPLSHNQVCDFPIQGTASELAEIAMARLSRDAYRYKIPWIRPRINVHDELLFMVPEDKVNEALELIIPTMLYCKDLPWLTVPIEVSVETGKAWGAMEKLTTFKSTDLGHKL